MKTNQTFHRKTHQAAFQAKINRGEQGNCGGIEAIRRTYFSKIMKT